MHYCCLCLILSLSKLNKTHVCACVSVHAGVTSSLISPTNFFWHNLSVTCNSVSSRLTGDWVPGSACLHSPLLELQVQSCLDFCLFLTWVWGSELRFSCLRSKPLPLEPSASFRHQVGGQFVSNRWVLTWCILWSMGPLLLAGYAYTTSTTSCCLPTHRRCYILYRASFCNSWVYTCILISCRLPICLFEHYHFDCRGFLIYFNIWGCKFSQTLVFFVQTFMLLFTHSEINFIIILYSSRKKNP